MQLLSFLKINTEACARIPPDFLYINQDNYYLANLAAPEFGFLYTDSATSCMILVIEGYNKAQVPNVLFAHIGSPQTFDLLSALIPDNFQGKVNLYAQGANPPDNAAAITNSCYLHTWLTQQQEQLDTVSLALAQGHPDTWGCLGIDLRQRFITRQPYALTHEQRNTKVQLLYSLFRSAPALWNAAQPFPAALVESFKQAASVYDWEQIRQLDDAQLLAYFSTTPLSEPPWFADGVRITARWLIDSYNSKVKFSKP